ncbi:MAG: Holliday junction branch migration protein RuvA [Lachnospiraceae bacterium]|nr:Holliday junction branch migration protein RuvA [Lachnospiraceae bacterium]
MIAFIKGTVADISSDTIVLDCNGMGFEICVPTSVIAEVRGGEEVMIYTYMYVREDAMNLYGFLTKDDLEVFKQLIKVNNVGPKNAVAILSAMSSTDLKYAVLSGDSKSISKAPGIGAKTAQKIILELKDKFDLEEMLEEGAKGQKGKTSDAAVSRAATEAVMALTSLGYTDSKAWKAVRSIEITDDMDTEMVLKAALKEIIKL